MSLHNLDEAESVKVSAPPSPHMSHEAGGTEQILSRIRRMESDEEPSSGTDAWITTGSITQYTLY